MGAVNRPFGAIFALTCVALAASLANLFFIGINGNPLVLLTCIVALVILIQPGAIDLSVKELFWLILTGSALCLFGLLDHNHFVGFNYNVNAVGAALVILSAYIIARHLHRSGMAYTFAQVGFCVVLAPAIYQIIASSSGRLADLFTYSSENFVTSWLIITSLAMCATRIAQGKAPPIWPVAITFVVALSQYTRGSIAVAFIALIAVLYVRLGPKKALLIAAAMLVSAIPFGGLIADAFWEAIGTTKFGARGLETPRWAMWESYIDYQTWGSFLLGADTEVIPLISDYGGNPHNTFIRFHAYYGIIPLIAFIVVLLRKSPQAPMLAAFVGIILLRAGSDSLLAGTVLDVFFMIAAVPLLMATKPKVVRVVRRPKVRVKRAVVEEPDDLRQAA